MRRGRRVVAAGVAVGFLGAAVAIAAVLRREPAATRVSTRPATSSDLTVPSVTLPDITTTTSAATTTTSTLRAAVITTATTALSRPCRIDEFATPGPGSQPAAVATGPDGALWYYDRGRHVIGRMTTAGTATSSFPLPNGASVQAMVAGKDGAVYFTDPANSAVGRLVESGDITEFPTPTRTGNPVGPGGPGAGPFDLTVGSDGVVWFTEASADKLGRVTSTGGITEYDLPGRTSVHANPEGIDAGPDGAIWFTEPLTERMGRFDIGTHSFAELPWPNPGAGAVRGATLTSAGGGLWFDDPRGNAMMRMAPDGMTTSVRIPTPNAGTGASVRAADESVWFLETDANRVGHIDNGHVIELPLAAPNALKDATTSAITLASDGTIWFAEPGAGRLGRARC